MQLDARFEGNRRRSSVSIVKRSALCQPYDDVDVADARADGRLGQTVDANAVTRNVHQVAFALEIEMIVVRRVGVEVGLGAFNGELAQEAGAFELMQGVVDRRE